MNGPRNITASACGCARTDVNDVARPGDASNGRREQVSVLEGWEARIRRYWSGPPPPLGRCLRGRRSRPTMARRGRISDPAKRTPLRRCPQHPHLVNEPSAPSDWNGRVDMPLRHLITAAMLMLPGTIAAQERVGSGQELRIRLGQDDRRWRKETSASRVPWFHTMQTPSVYATQRTAMSPPFRTRARHWSPPTIATVGEEQ
jgi:hypothetical protein